MVDIPATMAVEDDAGQLGMVNTINVQVVDHADHWFLLLQPSWKRFEILCPHPKNQPTIPPQT
jgi:hypothetical protein